ncbi:hypothetical protein [Micromonospora psammae]|uniref:hypothetical protein n=1 Tax=Micromonospora sp. CPCC 205556 TaxID=3122398 RepID=UPI002FF19E5B
MTTPDERGGALPARDEPTVHLSEAPERPTARPTPGPRSAGEPTVQLAAGEPTVHVAAGDLAGDATVRLTAAEATGRGVPAAAAPVTHVGEVRFGPGVPAAPAWPVTAPRRPRPLRRRITAVVSTLLTVALVAAVGFWLWQRLSPLEVTGVRVAVPQPAGNRCDVTVEVVATVATNGRGGVIEYQWLRSGSSPGAILAERTGWRQRTATFTLKWTFSGAGSTTETATVNIVSPTPTQASTEVSYTCRRP